jgi:pimeloyl-ACP methyl ester carboxylesterase
MVVTGQSPSPLHVLTRGTGPRTLWIHGTMSDAVRTWRRQSHLAERWLLLQPARRGTPPSPPAEGNDFAVDAQDIAGLLDVPAHVIAHSYGCIGTLIAVGMRPDNVTSLTLVEPPAYQVLGPDAEAQAAVDSFMRLRRLESPDDFLPAFVETFLGSPSKRVPLDPATRRLVELTIRERPPWTAELPLEAIRDAGTPVMVVSGGHSRLFEKCADALVRELGPGAERALLAGAGHNVQRLGEPFNTVVERFWTRHPVSAPPVTA